MSMRMSVESQKAGLRPSPAGSFKTSRWKSLARNWELYLMLAPVIAYFFIFHYLPMYGVQIAFKDYIAPKGVWGSPWVGFKHLERFVSSYYFWRIIWNTISISLYQLALVFPAPILLALMINEVRSRMFKRTVQTVTYAPHFLSTVVTVGMLFIFLHPKTGLVSFILRWLEYPPIYFMTEPSWFKTVYVLSEVWQQAGWGTIIYLAALSSVDPQLHEAAKVDGASRLKRIYHINLPAILPTVMILFILNIGSLLSVGFEKVYLMQNSMNMASSDIIATYVYRTGILGAQYSFSAAVGLLNSIINMMLLLSFNRLSRRVSGSSLW